MDKNTLIGFLLITAILVGFGMFTKKPAATAEDVALRDSIMQEQLLEYAEAEAARNLNVETDTINAALPDSVKALQADSLTAVQFGILAPAAKGNDTTFVLENDLLKLTVDAKGGAVSSVELKNYTNYYKQPLVLFDSNDYDGAFQSLILNTSDNRNVDTKDLYFTAKQLNDSVLEMSLPIQDGALKYIYTVRKGSYLVDFDIKGDGISNYFNKNQGNTLQMHMGMNMRKQERGKKFENRYSGLYYRPEGEDVEHLSNEESASDEVKTANVQWIGFKDQFFSSVIIARGENHFDYLYLNSQLYPEGDATLPYIYLKGFDSQMRVTFDYSGQKATTLQYFFGPNKFELLQSLDDDAQEGSELHLEELLDLGWTIIGWINQYIIIPIFNWLGSFLNNYGLIILLLTIIIKLIILPFTFKSYMSTAKMRVLRPQIEEINKKIPEDKAMERQQATMNLYRSAGVSPMGGCLPMLLQMPILFAMFIFFPTCIELRQQSFLWADDLSAYDAILTWDTYIPFFSWAFDNHLSLFCLLMCITNVVYSYINMKDQPTNGQMPAMKWMMYLMPVMFLFIFNDYAAGLSYYYFMSLLFTIIQTFIFRLAVNDKKVLAQLEENKKKPKKGSSFMEKLEKMQKEQQAIAREQAKKNDAKRR